MNGSSSCTQAMASSLSDARILTPSGDLIVSLLEQSDVTMEMFTGCLDSSSNDSANDGVEDMEPLAQETNECLGIFKSISV